MLKLNEVNTKEVKGLIAKGSNVATIKGSVNYLINKEGKNAIIDREVVAYLSSLGYIAPKRGTSFRGDFYTALEEGNLSKENFSKMLEDASDNTLKNIKHFNAIRVLCNKVREQASVIAIKNPKGGK